MTGLGAGGISSFPGATPGQPYPQYDSIYFGIVNNNSDPLKKNRCLLQVPQLFGTAVTTWAVSLTPLQTVPKVGTVITAMFIGGDVDYPVYLVTDPQLLTEGTAGNIKPVGTAPSAGTSTKYAAADHVHGSINTNAATITTITQGASAAAGASGQIADAAHVHAMAALNYLIAGTSGYLDVPSSPAYVGDNQASIQLESAGFAGQTECNIIATATSVSNNLNIGGTEITFGGGVASITANNFNMEIPMGTPPNSGAVSGGTASLSQLCAFAYAIYSEMQNRGMFN